VGRNFWEDNNKFPEISQLTTLHTAIHASHALLLH